MSTPSDQLDLRDNPASNKPGAVQKALMVFFDYLAEHHPQLRRLDQLDRVRHIEPFLA